MTKVPKIFYRQVTYDDQKQAYVFIENIAIFPLENNLCVIYHEATKQSYEYDGKTRQCKQISFHECECSQVIYYVKM